jgi:hypothetical protein
MFRRKNNHLNIYYVTFWAKNPIPNANRVDTDEEKASVCQNKSKRELLFRHLLL